jgi:hypothetical protein
LFPSVAWSEPAEGRGIHKKNGSERNEVMFLVKPDFLGIPFLTYTHIEVKNCTQGLVVKKNQLSEVCTNEAMFLVSLYCSVLEVVVHGIQRLHAKNVRERIS